METEWSEDDLYYNLLGGGNGLDDVKAGWRYDKNSDNDNGSENEKQGNSDGGGEKKKYNEDKGNEKGTLLFLGFSAATARLVGLNTEFGLVINLNNGQGEFLLKIGASGGYGNSAGFEASFQLNTSINEYNGKNGSGLENPAEFEGGWGRWGGNIVMDSDGKLSGFGFSFSGGYGGFMNLANYTFHTNTFDITKAVNSLMKPELNSRGYFKR